jgi:hypothetical protein
MKFEISRRDSANKLMPTNSVEPSPSSDKNSCSVTQEIPGVVLNPKFFHLAHKCPPTAPVQKQINLAHILPSYFFKIYVV